MRAGWRVFLWIAGSLSLCLGVIGLFLPIMPTVPFVLLAAACYARASPRLHAWLLANRSFGPAIRQWEEHRAISRRAKYYALTLMAVSFPLSIFFVLGGKPWLQGTLFAIWIAVSLWLAYLPTREPE